MNGNPSAGRNIKPYLHYWEKQVNEKDDIAARDRLREIWENCMEDKGY